MTLIPDLSIYEGLEAWGLPDDRQGFASSISPLFDELVAEVKPKAIIEAGSWKGVSACRWADIAGPECLVYCVDTWLCGFDQLRPDITYNIPRRNGGSLVYWQFLQNVKTNGLEKQIVPIQNTSANGARILKQHGVKAGIVFIDGSHEYRDAYEDLVDYWPLVEDGGVMLVDDAKLFPGVWAAIVRFAEEAGLWKQLTFKGDQFAMFRKTV